MNGLDDDDIRRRLNSMFDEEPPMASVAVDDLARGRQLVRRRRRTAMVATATALPAVLVGGWAVSTAAFGSSGSATLQPADGTDPTDAGDDGTVTVCWVAAATPVPDDGGAATSNKPPSPTVSSGEDAPATVEPTPGDPAQCEAVPWVADDCSTSFALNVPDDSTTSGSSSKGSQEKSQTNPDKSGGVNAAPDANGDGGTTKLDPGYTLLVPPEGLGDGTPGTVGFVCDALGTILQQHADPAGEHSGTMASGSANATTGDGPESASASIGWADGDREGQVTLAVSQTPATSDCLSPDVESGPRVTCDVRTLDDGTEVRVGHGSQDGATRVSVEYDRPDGTTVWAIADEATDAWWDGDHGTDPLTASPMTVDDLISMALDKNIK